jgi:hypothetical protein
MTLSPSPLGVVTVAKPLDYEQMRSTQFVVVAVDAGNPELSSTATINVQIININDETPRFSQVSRNINIIIVHKIYQFNNT